MRWSLSSLLALLFCPFTFAAALGLHYGRDQDIAQYQAFEQWLGAPLVYRVTFADRATWDTISNPWVIASGGTGNWLADLLHREVLTIPLVATGSTLDENHDAHFRTLAAKIKPFGDRLIIRLGWEGNGNWFPWSYIQDPAAYRAAFRRAVLAMREITPVRIEWNVSCRADDIDWREGYPGDDIVDIVSMDIYDRYESWDSLLNGAAGLKELRAFAVAKDKPEAYPEWGVSTTTNGHGDNPVFIQNMVTWFKGGNVLYQSYWNATDVGATIFGGGATAPLAGEKFRELLGGPLAPTTLSITQ